MSLKNHKAALLFMLMGSSLLTHAQSNTDISMFPKAKPGQKQVVINLPKKANENLFNIELIPGKDVLVDCNSYSLQGSITGKGVKGWGFSYYEFTTDGTMNGTRMGCPNGKQTKFISALSTMVDYNSRLPIVIYIPENCKLKYRIWTSDGNETEVTDGTTSTNKENNQVTTIDVLKKMGMTTFQYGTHMVGKYAVKSKTINLDNYEGKKVTITGKKVAGYPLDGGPELLEVTNIQVAK